MGNEASKKKNVLVQPEEVLSAPQKQYKKEELLECIEFNIDYLKKWTRLNDYSVIFDSDIETYDDFIGKVLDKRNLCHVLYSLDKGIFGYFQPLPITSCNKEFVQNGSFIFRLRQRWDDKEDKETDINFIREGLTVPRRWEFDHPSTCDDLYECILIGNKNDNFLFKVYYGGFVVPKPLGTPSEFGAIGMCHFPVRHDLQEDSSYKWIKDDFVGGNLEANFYDDALPPTTATITRVVTLQFN